MLNVTALLEIAKISPYLIIPLVFAWLLWKANEKHVEFVNQVMSDKNQHYSALVANTEKLSQVFETKLEAFAQEYRNKQEGHNDIVLRKVGEVSTKIDSLRIELAWGDKK